MNASTYEERMAVRLASQMAGAQAAYDNLAEPECDSDTPDYAEAIRIAEDYIGKAERMLADGRMDAARDFIETAARELCDVAGLSVREPQP